jgi:uncharacterized protein YecE (DUF72 family)
VAVYVGTSGWAYAEWKPKFYPQDLPQKKFLSHYASKLNSVEVNYTFRSKLTEKTALKWLESIPEGFNFTFKASQWITHVKRLRNVDESVALFLQSISLFEMQGRLGCVLVQLPHNMQADPELLGGFLKSLPKRLRVAVEFRHESWLNECVYSVLRNCGAAMCVTEGTHELSTADIETAAFRYYRLRRESYSAAQIKALAEKLRGTESFVYFKHEDDPRGALNAVKLRKALETA